MPVPVETLRNMRRMNGWFAASALAGAVSMFWMLWADYARPWRDFQTQYFDVQSSLAHLDYLGYQTQSSQAERKRLADAVAEAERVVALRDREEKEWQTDLRRTTGRLQGEALAYGNLKAQIQVTEFQFEEMRTLHGPDDERTAQKKKQFADERTELGRLEKSKEALEDRERQLKRNLKTLYAARDDARKKLTAFDKGKSDAERRERLYGPNGSLLFGLVPARAFFNAPSLDYLTPKNTPGREEIKQVVLPDVRTEMNFAQSYATDRCTTCHVAIDNPDMTREKLAHRLEAALRAVNEERARHNEKPLEAAVPTVKVASKDKPVALTLAEMNPAQMDQYLHGLADTVNQYLRAEGRPEIRYGQPLLAHPDLALYVTPDSPHSMKKMGCTVCHEGNGQETDFVLASHTAADRHQEHEWEKKYYVRWLGIPENTLHLAHDY